MRGARSAGAALAVTAVAAVLALQYWMPRDWMTLVGFADHGAVVHFSHAVLGRVPTRLPGRAYAALLQALLAAAWVGYAGFLMAAWRIGPPPLRRTLILVAVVGVGMVCFTPPSLTPDAYLSAAYARMQLSHGINPYVHTEEQLAAIAEPHARFLGSSGYGPVWTLIVLAVEAPLQRVGLLPQVVALRLLALAALIGCALVGRTLAEQLEPGRGNLAAAAIALNPLLLLEGPGGAHNDTVMLFLLLGGVHVCRRNRYLAGVFVLALSAGVKYVTGAFLPWMYLEEVRRGRERWLPLGVRTVLVTALPLTLAYAPFWQSAAALTGLLENFTHNAGRGTMAVAPLLALVALYLVLTLWVARATDEPRWVTAWTALTLLLFFRSELRHPWYLSWPITVSLLRWDAPQRAASALCCATAALLTFFYGVPV